MQTDIKAAVEATVMGSDAGAMTFPEVIGRLAEAGVERYHADLQRAEKTFYLPDGTSHVARAKSIDGPVADDFDATAVEAAIRAVQKREIGYGEFCERIAAAGCASYIVSLSGRRAVYYGRTGEIFVEPFPQAA